MQYTEEFDQRAAGAVAGLTLTATAGLAELLIATVRAAAGVGRAVARAGRRIAPLLRGEAAQAPHIALLRVPGEFVTGAWR